MGPKTLCLWWMMLPGMLWDSFPPFVYTEADHYQQCGERFPSHASLVLVENGQRRALAPELFASADADISFDGKRILFAGKLRKGGPWQIWEIPVAGGKARAVTNFPEDAVTPHYLPDEKVVYARRTPSGFALEVLPLAGGAPDRLTYAPGDFLVSDVLADGRLLFEGPHPAGGRDLYTVYSDGTFPEAYRCDHGRDRHAGRQVASGDIVFQEGDRLARFTSALAQEVALRMPAARFAGPVAGGGQCRFRQSPLAVPPGCRHAMPGETAGAERRLPPPARGGSGAQATAAAPFRAHAAAGRGQPAVPEHLCFEAGVPGRFDRRSEVLHAGGGGRGAAAGRNPGRTGRFLLCPGAPGPAHPAGSAGSIRPHARSGARLVLDAQGRATGLRRLPRRSRARAGKCRARGAFAFHKAGKAHRREVR